MFRPFAIWLQLSHQNLHHQCDWIQRVSLCHLEVSPFHTPYKHKPFPLLLFIVINLIFIVVFTINSSSAWISHQVHQQWDRVQSPPFQPSILCFSFSPFHYSVLIYRQTFASSSLLLRRISKCLQIHAKIWFRRIIQPSHSTIHDICRRHCLWSKKIHDINFAPHNYIVCTVMWSVGKLLHNHMCSVRAIGDWSIWQIYNVFWFGVIYAVLMQNQFCWDLRTFVWNKN